MKLMRLVFVLRDLLGKDQKKRLELKERPDTGVYVKDLQQFVCKSVNEIQHVMTVGNQNRAVGWADVHYFSSLVFILEFRICSTIGIGIIFRSKPYGIK